MTTEEVLWRYKIQSSGTGPLIIEVDEPQMTVGLFYMPEGILAGDVGSLVDLFPFVEDAAKRGQGVILLPSLKNISQNPFPQCRYWPKGTYRMMRRHEMTHWMRWRQKKFVYVPRTTFWSLLILLREEVVAYRSQLRIHAPETWSSALENSSASWWRKALMRVKGKKACLSLRLSAAIDLPFTLYTSMTNMGLLGERPQKLGAHLQQMTVRIGAYFTQREQKKRER